MFLVLSQECKRTSRPCHNIIDTLRWRLLWSVMQMGALLLAFVTFYKHVRLYTVYCGSSASLKFLQIFSVVKL